MWYYKGKEVRAIDNMPIGAIGFIYQISLLDFDDSWPDKMHPTKFYIGKKQIYSNRRTKITNKQKLESGNNRKQFKIVTKESDWLTYNSSCKELQTEIKNLGEARFLKEIIEFCFSKRELTYKEVWWQFKEEVLERDTWNANIMSRFFRDKLK